MPQRCYKLSKARHNNYVANLQKVSKVWNWNCPSLQQLRFCISIGSALGVELFDYIVDLFFFFWWGWGTCKSLAGEEPKGGYIALTFNCYSECHLAVAHFFFFLFFLWLLPQNNFRYIYIYITYIYIHTLYMGKILDLHWVRLSNVNAAPFREIYTKLSEDNTEI